MGIEQIKKKVIEDAESEAKRIIEEAKEQKAKAIQEARNEAERLTAELVQKANEEAERLIRTTISQAQLESLREISDLERKILTTVFEQALQKFFHLEKDLLENFLINAVINSGSRGDEEVLFSSNLREIAHKSFIKKLNMKAKEKGRRGDYRLGVSEATGADIELAGDGYRILISVKETLQEEGPELEKEILRLLKSDHG